MKRFLSALLSLVLTLGAISHVYAGPVIPPAKAPRIRIASPAGGWNYLSPVLAQSNGTTQLTRTDQFIFQLNSDYRNLQLFVVNGWVTSSAITNYNGNAINFHAAHEINGNLVDYPWSGSTGVAVSSGGRTATAIADGQSILSGPVASGFYFTSGSSQTVRLYSAVTAGQKIPYTAVNNTNGWTLNHTTDVVYAQTNNTGSDMSITYGSATWGLPTSSPTPYAWSPVAVIGEQATPKVVVLVLGNSIDYGTGSAYGKGYIAQALIDAGIGYHNDGLAGSTLGDQSRYNTVAGILANYADYVTLGNLTNDVWNSQVTTLAQAKTVMLNLSRLVATKNNRLILETMLPRPATTDSCATYGNQTPSASFETLRVTLNNWMRDQTSAGAIAYINANLPSANVVGVIDATPAIERNANGTTVTLDANGQQAGGTGGYWLPGNSADCIHPNTTGVTAMKANVPATLFPLF